MEEKDERIGELELENQTLKHKISALESKEASAAFNGEPSYSSVDESKVLIDRETECERRRSIIVSNVPELKGARMNDRVCYDFDIICQVLQFLDVECYPVAVYRLGRPASGGRRLLKVVFPSSKFQQIALNRSNRLRFFNLGNVYIRPSLTAEERRRRRELRSRTASHMSSPSVGDDIKVSSPRNTEEVHSSDTSLPPLN
ncbi:unnamed protein product [Nippostrongylus brasiliensis]|uniref:Uncharacterized protein n=1 Tax=Nippostrongylus brasiliensis TaxID=27835 RepID=A0A3P7BCR9_NIPBR|nr:unnamed protein product [Nippostrongylus brasiliensis]